MSVVSVLRSLKDERSGLCHRSASARHSSVSQDVECLYENEMSCCQLFTFAKVRCRVRVRVSWVMFVTSSGLELVYNIPLNMKYNKTSAQLSSAGPPAAFLFVQFGWTGPVVGRGRGEDASLRGAVAAAATAGRAGGPGSPGGEEAGPGWLVALKDTQWRLTVQQTLLLALEVVPVAATAAVLEGGAGAVAEVVRPALYAAPALTRVSSLTAVRLARA